MTGVCDREQALRTVEPLSQRDQEEEGHWSKIMSPLGAPSIQQDKEAA